MSVDFTASVANLLSDPIYRKMVAAQETWCDSILASIKDWDDFSPKGKEELAIQTVRYQEARKLLYMMSKEPEIILSDAKKMRDEINGDSEHNSTDR